MIEVQDTKRVIMLRPQLKNNGAFENNTYVDCAGWGHLRVEFILGDTDVAVGSGDAATPPKLEECDTEGGSYSDITDAELAAVLAANDDNKAKAIDLSLTHSHKRFVRVNAPTADNGVTGCNLCIIATLSKPNIGPKDADGQGLAELVVV
ncbi:MAG: hypothetical protein PHQ35_05985 [Phycisphaerae bacterium]|nr:hypothetical protein [Phycisphaerae bacterium]MDD5381272.1 hypothetical protein [Phycisphaerae bacterium]